MIDVPNAIFYFFVGANICGNEKFYKFKTYIRLMTDMSRDQKVAPLDCSGFYLCQKGQTAAGSSFRDRRSLFMDEATKVFTTSSRWFMGPFVTDLWKASGMSLKTTLNAQYILVLGPVPPGVGIFIKLIPDSAEGAIEAYNFGNLRFKYVIEDCKLHLQCGEMTPSAFSGKCMQ